MSVTGARMALASEVHEKSARARAWRPFPVEVADILCVENAHENVAPRMHDRFSMTVVRTAGVIRCESTRSLVAAPSCVLLVPALQLYSLRAQGRRAGGSVTLLVGASHLAGIGATERAGLVADLTLVEQVEALVARLSRPVRSVEWATTIGELLERLTSIGAARASAGSHAASLGRVRDYLRDNPGELVTIAELAALAGLTESHLIRAFHREFGLPPHAYHLRRRLAAASELLASGVSVSTVAYECGFADQSHLSRKFKEVYGLTPAAWATAVATGARGKAPAKMVPTGIPQRETHVARAISW